MRSVQTLLLPSLLALFTATLAPAPVAAATLNDTYLLDRIVIYLQPGVDPQAFFGEKWPYVKTVTTPAGGTAYVLYFAPATRKKILARCAYYRLDSRVQSAGPLSTSGPDYGPSPIPITAISTPSLDPAIAGRYTGKVTIRKNLSEEGLSSAQVYKAEALLSDDSEITILTAVPEGPATSLTSSTVVIRGLATSANPDATINYLINTEVPALLVIRSNQLKLTFEKTVTPDPDLGPPVTTQFEFVLRKAKQK